MTGGVGLGCQFVWCSYADMSSCEYVCEFVWCSQAEKASATLHEAFKSSIPRFPFFAIMYLVLWANVLVDLDGINSGWHIPKSASAQHTHHTSQTYTRTSQTAHTKLASICKAEASRATPPLCTIIDID